MPEKHWQFPPCALWRSRRCKFLGFCGLRSSECGQFQNFVPERKGAAKQLVRDLAKLSSHHMEIYSPKFISCNHVIDFSGNSKFISSTHTHTQQQLPVAFLEGGVISLCPRITFLHLTAPSLEHIKSCSVCKGLKISFPDARAKFLGPAHITPTSNLANIFTLMSVSLA